MSKPKADPAPVSPLARLQSLQQCQAANPQLFPSLDSIRWYLKRNRPELVERGAVVIIAGRLFVEPAQFAEAVVEIGRATATRRAA